VKRRGSIEGAKRGGTIAGAIAKFRKSGICSPEVQSRAGKIGGAITGRENARLQRGICAPGVSSLGGKKAADTMRALGSGTFNPDIRAKGRHVNWHVKRGIRKPDCKYCLLEPRINIH
jgi:hypothetical protein